MLIEILSVMVKIFQSFASHSYITEIIGDITVLILVDSVTKHFLFESITLIKRHNFLNLYHILWCPSLFRIIKT